MGTPSRIWPESTKNVMSLHRQTGADWVSIALGDVRWGHLRKGTPLASRHSHPKRFSRVSKKQKQSRDGIHGKRSTRTPRSRVTTPAPRGPAPTRAGGTLLCSCAASRDAKNRIEDFYQSRDARRARSRTGRKASSAQDKDVLKLTWIFGRRSPDLRRHRASTTSREKIDGSKVAVRRPNLATPQLRGVESQRHMLVAAPSARRPPPVLAGSPNEGTLRNRRRLK